MEAAAAAAAAAANTKSKVFFPSSSQSDKELHLTYVVDLQKQLHGTPCCKNTNIDDHSIDKQMI
jgi:hypothetical protein